MVEDGALVGVVSLRDLFAVARLRPADEAGAEVPRGLEGVVVAETRSATSAGSRASTTTASTRRSSWPRPRSLEDVWYLLFDGRLPDARRAGRASRPRSPTLRDAAPPGLADPAPDRWPATGVPLDVLRTAVSLLGAELGWRPTHDIDRADSARPGAAALRRRADDPRRRLPAPPGCEPVAAAPRPRLRRQLPVDAPGAEPIRRAAPGRSSST